VALNEDARFRENTECPRSVGRDSDSCSASWRSAGSRSPGQ
jgi:hypothetical protein